METRTNDRRKCERDPHTKAKLSQKLQRRLNINKTSTVIYLGIFLFVLYAAVIRPDRMYAESEKALAEVRKELRETQVKLIACTPLTSSSRSR